VVSLFREIILSGHSVEDGYLTQLRNAGWTAANGYGPVVGYIDLQFAQGPSSCATDPNFAGLTTSWTSWDGEFCSMVNPNESWFLHTSTGARISRSGGWFYMDPSSVGWRNYMVGKIGRYFSTQFPGLDGIFLDDVWVNKSTTPGCASAICSNDQAWHDATMQNLQAIKAALPAGKKLTMNSSPGDTSQAGYAGVVDGFMIEDLGTGFFDGGWHSQAENEQDLADTDAEVTAGGDVLLVGQGDTQNSIQQMRFSHALYLMTAGPHVSFRFSNACCYAWWDYPEFHWNIGTPLGARTHPSPTVLRRDFSAGVALANEGTTSQTIQLGGSYITPSGALVTSVTLGAHEGMTLRAG